jgi:hypothetical protein
VRSVRPLILVGGAGLALLALAGCDSTQRQSARAKLSATRLLTARRPLRVTRADSAVRVGRVELVHRQGGAAIVVELRNRTTAPLTDLPISVGLESRHGRVYLNGRGGMSYFESHVAAVAAGAATTWVFTAPHLAHPAGRPFAVVGAPVHPPISSSGGLPRISATSVSKLGPTVRVAVHNDAGFPQYGLQVYAFARRGARYVAAGRRTVEHLGSNGSATVSLRLIGSTHGAALSVEAEPTIFE